MTISGSCFNDRDCCLIYNSFDQPCSASWNQYIHIFIHFHKGCCCLSRRILDQGNCLLRKVLIYKCFADCRHDCNIGMNRITATLQNHNISSLKAEGKCICRHIWSCLINNSDNAERYSFLTNHKSVWSFFHSQDLPDRIIQRCNLPQSFRHLRNPHFCQEQTIKQSFRHMIFLTILNINFVGIQNGILFFH